MRLTKYGHSCVEIEAGGARVLIDPGVLTHDVAGLLAAATTVLITHEHADHVDSNAVARALEADPGLRVLGPDAVVGRWREAFHAQVHAVAEGDSFAIEGLEVRVFGRLHAMVHPDIARCANVGYLVGGRVYHPGDSLEMPPADVEVLLVPTSGPWMKLSEVIDFVRAVAPDRAIEIHEAAASDFGRRIAMAQLGPRGLTDAPLERLSPGESVEL